MKKIILSVLAVIGVGAMETDAAVQFSVYDDEGKELFTMPTTPSYVAFTNQPPCGGAVGEVVDMGLSVKWASWNVGASKPEEYGIIIDISEEGTISFIHSGTGGPKSGSYKKDGGGYWDSRVRGFFQWDTNDANSQIMTVNPAKNGLPQFRQGKLPTFTEKLKENRIPIVRTFGEILSILIQ